jgi:glyoxylase-like metal-dependent hydrolase (beta-lactamase superfamily II)
MANPRLTIGNVELLALLDVSITFDPAAAFPDIPPGAWKEWQARYPKAFTQDGRLLSNAACYLLRSQGKTILIDTGSGPEPVESSNGAPGRLLEDLASRGVRPGDVDIVAFTHLHSDHIGWNLTPDGKPTFPRAQYLIPEVDWEFFTRPHVLENPALGTPVKEQVLPLQQFGIVQLFSGQTALTEELTPTPTPGHTRGHTSFLIASRGEKALITGDLAHHPVQVEQTEWATAFDGNPTRAAESRRRIFEHLEAEEMVAAFCHFPSPGFGRIVRFEGKRVFQAQ